VRCWFAPVDLRIGAPIRSTIDESIRAYDKLLLVLSEHSISSKWVEQEAETALDRERERNHTVAFPIRLADSVMSSILGWTAYLRRTRNIGDFRHWRNQEQYSRAFDRLVRDLRLD